MVKAQVVKESLGPLLLRISLVIALVPTYSS